MSKIDVIDNFDGLTDRCKLLLKALWNITLDFKEDKQNIKTRKLYRSYQSDLSQDEQQRILRNLVTYLQCALGEQSQLHLREICKEAWKSSSHSRTSLQWTMSSDALMRAQGQLPLSLKIIVDATGAAKSCKYKQSFNKVCSHKALDTQLVLLPSLETIERELLHQVVLESARTNTSLTVLVLVYIVLGRIQWPYQEYDCHITKIIIHPDGTALYEDHAMSEETRLMMEKNYLWCKCSGKGKGEYFYTNNQRDKNNIDSNNDNNKHNKVNGCSTSTDNTSRNSNSMKQKPPSKKRKVTSTKRPDWAYVGLDQVPEGCGGLVDPKILPLKLLESQKYILDTDVKIFSLQNSWNIRVLHMLQHELREMGVSLQHIQINEYQSWNISQCALAMMFDLYTGIPDQFRKQVCEIFSTHPCCIQQTLKSVDNRSGNNTLMNLFEKWLISTQYILFEEAISWCGVNSLRIGDELSSGLCSCCGQTDSPSFTLLCEVDNCPGAMHSFCCSVDGLVDINAPWYCDSHNKIENSNT